MAPGHAGADDCPLGEVVAALMAMLAHRGWDGHPVDDTWGGDWAFLWPAPCSCATAAVVATTPGGGECTDRPRLHVGLLVHCPAQSTLLLVTDQSRVGMVHLRQAHDVLRRLGVRRMQLVCRQNITTQTMHLNQSLPTDHHVSILLWSLLCMYPLDHALVPRHRLATREERARLTPVTQLPTLRADDAIAVYLGLRPGDVVRIDRPDGSTYWRHVV